jgi:hypothetical protein
VPAVISPKKYLKINPIYFSPTENLSKIWNFIPKNGKGEGRKARGERRGAKGEGRKARGERRGAKGEGRGQNERVWNCELFFANSKCEAAALSIEENVPFNFIVKLQWS